MKIITKNAVDVNLLVYTVKQRDKKIVITLWSRDPIKEGYALDVKYDYGIIFAPLSNGANYPTTLLKVEEILENRDIKGSFQDPSLNKNSFYKLLCEPIHLLSDEEEEFLIKKMFSESEKREKKMKKSIGMR